METERLRVELLIFTSPTIFSNGEMKGIQSSWLEHATKI